MRTMQDGRMDLFAAGNYRDLLRVGDGERVVFQERAAVLESRRVDVLIVIPI